ADAGRLAGHVRVTSPGPVSATVEAGAFGGHPRSAKLPERGRCEPVLVDFGDLRLRVAVDRTDDRGSRLPAEATTGPAALLRKLAAEKGSLIEVVPDPTRADWLVRPSKGGLYLLPA